MEPKDISLDEATEILDLAPSMVLQRMDSGKLPFTVDQGVRRVLLADVLRLKEAEDRRRSFAAKLGADTEDLESQVRRGSDDFLEDMGYADPDAMRVKIAIANKTALAMDDRGLSWEKAAAITGLAPIVIGAIEDGRVKDIDIEVLQAALTNIEEAE